MAAYHDRKVEQNVKDASAYRVSTLAQTRITICLKHACVHHADGIILCGHAEQREHACGNTSKVPALIQATIVFYATEQVHCNYCKDENFQSYEERNVGECR
eukprot:COSAG02_NODE_5184_length_4560_cov_35.274602_4_plen_102_part_00